MKRITFVLVSFILITAAAHAQNKKNVIKTNPLSLGLSNLNLSYERFLSEKVSVQMHAAYLLGFSREGYKFDAQTLTPEVRFYLTANERPKGFFLAPFGRYEKFNFKDNNEGTETTLTRMGGGLDAGYQFKLGNTVTWDIFGGPKYMVNNLTGDNNDVLFDNNFGFRFGTTFGIAF